MPTKKLQLIEPVPALRSLIFTQVENSPSRILAIGMRNHDDRLADLTCGLGLISGQLKSPALKETLLRMAGFCAGWRECVAGEFGGEDVFEKIHIERIRQEDLFRGGTHLFTCKSNVVDPKRKLRVLVEEAGEVAEAIDDLEKLQHVAPRVRDYQRAANRLATELIQVAAVAVAWLETPEVKP